MVERMGKKGFGFPLSYVQGAIVVSVDCLSVIVLRCV